MWAWPSKATWATSSSLTTKPAASTNQGSAYGAGTGWKSPTTDHERDAEGGQDGR